MKKSKGAISLWVITFLFVLAAIAVVDSNNLFQGNEKEAVADNQLTAGLLDGIGIFEMERTDGGYYTFVDKESGREIDQTARNVYEGDQIILSDNSLYEVEKIEGDTVYCVYKGKEEISYNEEAVFASSLAEKGNGSVAIYSTHSDESYVPTSGKESKPGSGDILEVSQVIGNVLEKQGVKAIVSLNKHDPHDANAYERSRRTAVQLLKNQPVTIIDVHRDGVPDPKFYAHEVDGVDATKVRLVVGRQNQNMQANLEYAKQMKAFYDQQKPGLIKGIFIAKGNYNQDLAPRSILIEVGTHTNSLEAANNGASAFASLLPDFLGIKGQTQQAAPAQQRTGRQIDGGTGSNIVWVLAIFIIGAIGFLLISTGSFKGSVDRIKGFGKEFASFLGSYRRKK
ncbi:MAG: stage II sporulation protein P [Clostridia bacterium]|nr:stage II sporulation protein P [Clostridia bacterium]